MSEFCSDVIRFIALAEMPNMSNIYLVGRTQTQEQEKHHGLVIFRKKIRLFRMNSRQG